jgi:carbamate kinase
LDVDVFVISTDADSVYLNYKKPDQQALAELQLPELRKYYNEGHFPPGNMGPKIEAVMRFLESGGKKAIITTFEFISDALVGKAGTTILP